MTALQRLLNFARQAGWGVGTSPIAQKMIQRIIQREAETGLLLCPCAFVPPDATPDILLSVRCPCAQALVAMADTGTCHCGLFYKERNDANDDDETREGSAGYLACG
jgi:ferredoxin-thioredoxin reductase catalytic subunit